MMTEIGKTYVEAAMPGSTASTKRICSVAYATEEMASEDSTASAVVLLSFCSSSRSEASGRPTSSRLLRIKSEGITPVQGAASRRAPLPVREWSIRSHLRLFGRGKYQGENTSASGAEPIGHVAALRSSEPARDGEPEAGTVRGVRRAGRTMEGLEDAILLALCNAGSAVGH